MFKPSESSGSSEATLRLSPFLLRKKEFRGEIPEDADRVEMTQDEVQEACFEVLGYLDEYRRVPETEAEFEAEKAALDQDDLEDVDAYLSPRKGKSEAKGSEMDKKALATEHRKLMADRIKALLAHPEVRKHLEQELEAESGRYDEVKKDLKRLRLLEQAEVEATLEMHRVYLQSKKKKGKVVESSGRRITHLSELVKKAKVEECGILEKAKRDHGPELGFIQAQEILEYKRQMKTKGFALTPSRRTLLNKIVEHAMAGHKVFLVGSTGTGKTELAFYAANELTGGFEIIPWHEGTVMKDVMGQMQIAKTGEGTIESRFKMGPLPRGMTGGKAVVHEEITVGSTRTMIGMKPYMNAKPGEVIKIPEMNGTALVVDEAFLEIFTGNPKDERTKDREDLDPAILRMLKGLQVEFMSSDELLKIILAQLIDDNGVLKLSRSEADLIRKLCEAAEMMQQCHDGKIEDDAAEALKQASGIEDFRITKNFLDPGTLFGLFAKYDYEQRKGKSFVEYLGEQLSDFIRDPKSAPVPEERALALGILKLKGVVSSGSTEKHVSIASKRPSGEKSYLLPSQLGFLSGKEAEVIADDPFAEKDEVDEALREAHEKAMGLLNRPVASKKKSTKKSPEPVAATTTAVTETPDNFDTLSEEEKMKIWEAQFHESLSVNAAFRHTDLKNQIKTVQGKIVKAPSWEEVKQAVSRKEVLNATKKLKSPTLLLVPAGGSFLEILAEMSQSEKDESDKREPRISYWSNWNSELGKDISGEVVAYDPKNPAQGKTKKDEALEWEVVIVDGTDEVPEETKRKSAKELVPELAAQGLSLMRKEAYVALQERGQVRGKQYDQNNWTLLNDYIKSLSSVAAGYWYPDFQRLELNYDAPSFKVGYLGARRSVRVKI